MKFPFDLPAIDQATLAISEYCVVPISYQTALFGIGQFVLSLKGSMVLRRSVCGAALAETNENWVYRIKNWAVDRTRIGDSPAILVIDSLRYSVTFKLVHGSTIPRQNQKTALCGEFKSWFGTT